MLRKLKRISQSKESVGEKDTLLFLCKNLIFSTKEKNVQGGKNAK